VSVPEEAFGAWGIPAIFNSDRGSQFTGALKEQGVRISMDGRKRAPDNILVERFWRRCEI
jgi:putative transposase